MAKNQDFLDEIVAERTTRNPEFPRLMEEARHRRELLRALADAREGRGLSQTAVAARMGTSQSSLARLESAAADTKLSTVERFAAALGYHVQYHLVAADGRKRKAPRGVVIHE